MPRITHEYIGAPEPATQRFAVKATGETGSGVAKAGLSSPISAGFYRAENDSRCRPVYGRHRRGPHLPRGLA